MALSPELQRLKASLQKRLDLIADHAFRDRDPEGHLAELREISESLTEQQRALASHVDARLNHYLTQCSYSKALDHLHGLEQQGNGD